MLRAGRRPSWHCAPPDAPLCPVSPPTRRRAPRRENRRGCRGQPRFWPMERARGVAANRRYVGSRDWVASMAPPGWFWPAIPAADRHSGRSAPLLHVKQASAPAPRLCRGTWSAQVFWAFAWMVFVVPRGIIQRVSLKALQATVIARRDLAAVTQRAQAEAGEENPALRWGGLWIASRSLSSGGA